MLDQARLDQLVFWYMVETCVFQSPGDMSNCILPWSALLQAKPRTNGLHLIHCLLVAAYLHGLVNQMDQTFLVQDDMGIPCTPNMITSSITDDGRVSACKPSCINGSDLYLTTLTPWNSLDLPTWNKALLTMICARIGKGQTYRKGQSFVWLNF